MTPREPDRYDKQVQEILAPGDFFRERLAAALRREHDAALDEAAQAFDSLARAGVDLMSEEAALQVRALKSPAAAPAADYDPITAPIPGGDMNGPHGPAPAAETGLPPLRTAKEAMAEGAEIDSQRVAIVEGRDPWSMPAPPSEPAAPAPLCPSCKQNLNAPSPSCLYNASRHVHAPAQRAEAPAPGVEDVAAAHRRYDAMAVHPLDPLVRVIVEPCEIGGHYRNRNGVTFHPSPCVRK